MESSLPYLASPGSIKTALERIRQAATPDRVTGDFVTTKLSIKGGTGYALIPFMKKVGLVAADGAPSELYKQFRNPATGGRAIANAIKTGYKKLEQVNEYFYELNDKDLQALIVQVTGAEPDSSVVKATLSTLKALKTFAKFDADPASEEIDVGIPKPELAPASGSSKHLTTSEKGLSLSYTININLPATSDQAVFNAIFRSLREHILSNAG